MFYHLVEALGARWDLPGSGLFQYLSFRSFLTITTALVLALIFGPWLIRTLRKHGIGDEPRDLGVEGQMAKQGVPSMGGLLIIGCTVIPVLLFCDLTNIYTWILLVTVIWLGTMGFIDDYLKKKHGKDGMKGKTKLAGQGLLGAFVACCLFFSPQVIISEPLQPGSVQENPGQISLEENVRPHTASMPVFQHKSTKTTIPFFKHNEFNYSWILGWTTANNRLARNMGWIIYAIMIILVVVAVSNGTNLNDGLDGMAAGNSAIVFVTLGVLAYLSGNFQYSQYLNIMFIPKTGEVSVFLAAATGALIGFLWYNCYPAQIFMGDTGSLMLGGLIGVSAIIIRKEILLLLLCGIFLVESLSVILQRIYFRYYKRTTGKGRRIFKMTPLHHHFQKTAGEIPDVLWDQPAQALQENKITIRFWIISILLAVLSIITLKVR